MTDMGDHNSVGLSMMTVSKEIVENMKHDNIDIPGSKQIMIDGLYIMDIILYLQGARKSIGRSHTLTGIICDAY